MISIARKHVLETIRDLAHDSVGCYELLEAELEGLSVRHQEQEALALADEFDEIAADLEKQWTET